MPYNINIKIKWGIMKKSKIKIAEKTEEPYKAGDFCYYIYSDFRVNLGEIQKVHNTKELIYTLVDQQSYKFVTVSHEQCFDDEKNAKTIAKQLKKEKK